MLDRRHVILVVIFGFACGIGLLLIPRGLVILSFWLGYDDLRSLFFDRIGLSGAVADFFANTLAFFLPMAIWFLFANVLAVWSGRANLSRVTKAFAAFALVYLLPSAVTAVRDAMGAPQCFDQRLGVPRLFYTIEPGGTVILSDKPGYDSTGLPRAPVTEAVCRIAERQRNRERPHQITADPHHIDYFDAAGGGARVFYSRRSDGKIILFDGPGVDPINNGVLQPITPAIVDELIHSADIEAQKLADEEARREKDKKRQMEQEQAEIQKQLKAQQQDADRKEAQRQAEIQKQLEAQQQEANRREAQLRDAERQKAALAELKKAAGASATGFECAFDIMGVVMPTRGSGSERYEFSRVTAFASYAAFYRSPNGIPRQNALTVELRGDNHSDANPRHCVLVLVSPAPVNVLPSLRLRSDAFLDDLQTMGVRTGPHVPSATARRRILLPTGTPPRPGLYGCVRGGMPSWCSGELHCSPGATIPVVSTECKIIDGIRQCRVTCES